MQRVIMVGVFGLLACGSKPTPGGPVLSIRCPDSTSCTQSNGTGVYFAEDGFAGIGRPEKLLITHFMPGASGVVFQGRYDAGLNIWPMLLEPGQVYRADYLDEAKLETGLEVVSVTEQDTAPTWTLRDPQHRRTFRVTDLRRLTLYIRFDLQVLGARLYVIDFNGPDVPVPDLGPRHRSAHRYTMRWREPNAGPGAMATYCEAQQQPDAVVFQQGFDIAPNDGMVTRTAVTANHVTMSCGLGAPAVVYSWGYDYMNGNTWYFDAGIHMKRASYCGDDQYYTKAGTQIEIADDQHINDERGPGKLEAWWTPQGASCLKEQRYPLKPFVRPCRNGKQVDSSCQPIPIAQPPPQYLIDSAP